MKLKKLFLAVLLLVLLGGGVLTLARYRSASGWSLYENRALAGAPEVTAQSVLSGSAASDLEDCLRDHFVGRDRLLMLSTHLSLLRGQPVVNGVVSTETALLPEPLGKTIDKAQLTADAQTIAARLSAVQRAVEDYGGTFLYIHVPEQRSVLRDRYPIWMTDDGAYLDAASAALLAALQDADVPALDLTSELTARAEKLYFSTDHHFNLYGADFVYESVCVQPSVQKWGVLHMKNTISDAKNPFLGTYGRELFGQSRLHESLAFYTPSIPYTRFDNGAPSDVPLIDVDENSQKTVFYAAYMGGDIGETILKTDRPALPSLLIVGDSFTNPVEALIYQSFDETRSLDFRHYSEKTLTEYLQDYQPEVVLVLRDDVSCLTLTGNGNLQ